MKRLLCVLLIGAMLLGALVSCKNDKKSGSLCDQYYDETDVTTNLVRMNISYTDANGKKQTGDIVVELNPTAAPITVKNFQKLVSEDFYDGLIFHRVIKDFMIQGGDPKGNGSGGSANNIKGEFSANGISNPISHTRGVISMARRGDSYDSASSQFFIVHQDAPHLNGQYAAFGKVVFGIEMVDIIAGVVTDRNDKPLNQVTINYMTFVVPKGEKPTEATTNAPAPTTSATEAPTAAPTEEPTTAQ